jgi:hypothetical protein
MGHRVNLESYNLLEEGMTEEDVEFILGVPAGDYTTYPFEYPSCFSGLPRARGKGPVSAISIWKEWRADGAEVTVIFEQGKMSSAHFVWLGRRADTFPELLRRWLRL